MDPACERGSRIHAPPGALERIHPASGSNDGLNRIVDRFICSVDTAKGNRPSFTDAARPEHAEPIYERVCAGLERAGLRVARGVFGARMQVELVNDGPVTIVLDV